jgi:membrane fusion protein, multidrug efflux system
MFVQGTLGTVRVSALSVPVSAVRTDKPAPYVQVIENGQIMHRAVETGDRGTSGTDTFVSVKGLPEGAVAVRGHIGTLREGTAVVFTKMPVAAGLPGQVASKPAP